MREPTRNEHGRGHRVIQLAAILAGSVVITSGGCTTLKVRSNGQVLGGTVRSRALIECIEKQRRKCGVGTQGDIMLLAYSAVIHPSSLSALSVGQLPQVPGGAPPAVYVVSSALDTVEDASFATVTEFMLNRNGETRCKGLLLQWDNRQNRWTVLQSMTRVEVLRK